jgi:hypothetical protein
MDGSNGIFIVLPIVALITLLILVGLPFIGDRPSGAGRSGGGHLRGGQAHGQITSQPTAPGGDAIGPGRA